MCCVVYRFNVATRQSRRCRRYQALDLFLPNSVSDGAGCWFSSLGSETDQQPLIIRSAFIKRSGQNLKSNRRFLSQGISLKNDTSKICPNKFIMLSGNPRPLSCHPFTFKFGGEEEEPIRASQWDACYWPVLLRLEDSKSGLISRRKNAVAAIGFVQRIHRSIQLLMPAWLWLSGLAWRSSKLISTKQRSNG